MREVIATGRDVEEATENGCAELGLSRDEVSVEILDLPVRKLFKSTPARVKVSALEDDLDETPTAQAAPPSQPAPKKEREEKQPPQQKAQKPAAPARDTHVLEVEPEFEINLAETPAAQAAVDYLTEIFTAMGAREVEITAVGQGDATLLRVEGGNFSEVLDVRGDTIQALSYLTDRAVNKGVDKREDNYLRVRLDVAGYRNRRETELIALAERTGKEVASTKRSRTLAPMNSYERLIVHTTISKMEGLMSESIGADTERRVVIKSTAPDATQGDDWKPYRRDNNSRSGNRGGGYKGNRNNDRDRRGNNSGNRNDRRSGGGGAPRTSTPEREYADKPRNTTEGPKVPERREALRDGDNLPLYGKIEL